jgi:hypothetical protein
LGNPEGAEADAVQAGGDTDGKSLPNHGTLFAAKPPGSWACVSHRRE